MNSLFRVFSISLALFVTTQVVSQVYVSEKIQHSNISQTDQNSLYFIDFWATWCVPCVYAKEYLEVLQKQNPKGFYVVSMSEENPDLVKRYLKKHKTDLAVFLDFQGSTFKKYEHQFLPYGVLLDAKGNVLWSGSPTDFKQSTLDKIKNRTKETSGVDDFFVLRKLYRVDEESESLNADSELKKVYTGYDDALQIYAFDDFTEFKGSLKDILAYFLKVEHNRVEVPQNFAGSYKFKLKKSKNSNAVNLLLDNLGARLSDYNKTGEMITFNMSSARLWDENQINWGADTGKFLIDDYQVQADNVTVQDFIYKMEVALQTPIKVSGNTSLGLYDWQVHYKFYNLMETDLLDNYGIKINKATMPYKVYKVEKIKAP